MKNYIFCCRHCGKLPEEIWWITEQDITSSGCGRHVNQIVWKTHRDYNGPYAMAHCIKKMQRISIYMGCKAGRGIAHNSVACQVKLNMMIPFYWLYTIFIYQHTNQFYNWYSSLPRSGLFLPRHLRGPAVVSTLSTIPENVLNYSLQTSHD